MTKGSGPNTSWIGTSKGIEDNGIKQKKWVIMYKIKLSVLCLKNLMSNLPYYLLFQVSSTMQLEKSFPILPDLAQLFANQSYQVCLLYLVVFFYARKCWIQTLQIKVLSKVGILSILD